MTVSLKDEALFRAVESGMVENIRAALSEGANVNARNKKNYTPLILAAMAKNSECVHLLLEMGADITASVYEDEEFVTSLDSAKGKVYDLLWQAWAKLAQENRPIPDEQARDFLTAYSFAHGHAGFRLKNGEWREGYFWVEPYAEVIHFSWAPSPMDSSEYDANAEDPISFEDIDLDSLCWGIPDNQDRKRSKRKIVLWFRE